MFKLNLNTMFCNFGFLMQSQITKEDSTQCLPNTQQISYSIRSSKSQSFTYLYDKSSMTLKKYSYAVNPLQNHALLTQNIKIYFFHRMSSIYYLDTMSLTSHLEYVNPVTLMLNKFPNITCKYICLSRLQKGYDTGCFAKFYENPLPEL